MTLRRRWTSAMLLVVLIGTGTMAAIAIAMSSTMAGYSADGWLGDGACNNADRTIEHWLDEMRRTLRLLPSQAPALSDQQRFAAAFDPGEVGGTISGGVAHTLGSCVGTWPLAHPPPEAGGPFWFRCGSDYAMGVASPRGASGAQDFVGRVIADAFADDLASRTLDNVTIIGPEGVIGTSIHDTWGHHLRPVFEGNISNFEHGHHVDTVWMTVPGYEGFRTLDGFVERGTSRLHVYAIASPVLLNIPLRIVHSVPYSSVRQGVTYTAIFMCLGGLITLLVLSLVVWRLIDALVKPIRGLGNAVRQVADGDLSVRVVPQGPLEIRELAERFNHMTQNLDEARRRVLQSEKMAAIGQLASGVAHEINNPLGVILGFAQGIDRRTQEGDPFKLPATAIVRETLRCKRLVQELLTFSRVGKRTTEKVDLGELIRSTVSLLEAQARTQGVVTKVDIAGAAPIIGSPTQLQQVLVNLGSNALDAMKGGGTLRVSCRGGKDGIRLEVGDTGTGIPEEIRSRVFEPFFTTKGVGEGTGLGLSLVYEIVTQHKGHVDFQSTPGKGTCFVVTFPVSADSQLAA